MADKRCDQCVTQGITLIPTRWGFSINKEDFTVESYARLVREGYIYVLDNNNTWYGYAVNEGRYLESFNVLDSTDNPEITTTDFVCNKGDNCKALKSFIRIPNPNQDIKTLWVAYSPVKWTKKILNNHRNNVDSAKRKNMIEVPVSATKSTSKDSLETESGQPAGGYDLWANDPDGEGIKELTQFLATEYFGDINPFTSQPYQPDKNSDRDNLIKTLEEFENNGDVDINRVLNVYLNDPVGMLIDLNEFIVQFESSSKNRYSETDLHQLDVALKIQNLEKSIKSGVRSKEIDKYFEKKVKSKKNLYTVYEYTSFPLAVSGFKPKINNVIKEALIQQIVLKDKEIQEIKDKYKFEADKVWEEYLEKYKSTEMEKFLTSGKGKQILDKNRSILENLLKEHQLIFKDNGFTRQMNYNFDTLDIISGVSYLVNVLQGIGVTVNYPECIKNYADDINTGSLEASDSHILRALVYNYQPVIDNIISESKKNIPWSAITQASWASIFNGGSSIYASNVIKGSAITQNAVAQLSAPLIKSIKQQANKPSISVATYAIGFHLQKEITRIDFHGKRHQAIKVLTELLDKHNTTSSNSTKIRFATSIINQLKVEGKANFQKGIRGHMLVLMDMNNATDILNTLELPNEPTPQGKQERIRIIDDKAKTTLLKRQQIYEIGSDEFNRFIAPEKKWSSTSGKLAMVGSIFQTLACASLLHSAVTSSESTQSNNVAKVIENSEGWSKLAGGLGFLLGGVLEGQARNLQTKLTNPALSIGSRDALSLKLSNRALWTKSINVSSGAIFALFDLYHAYDETTKANYGMMSLYILSAVAGMGSVIGMGATSSLTMAGVSMSWNFIGWALLVISIGVGIYIAFVSNNPIEEWIENSIWGNDAIYKNNYKKDIEEYENALIKMAG